MEPARALILTADSSDPGGIPRKLIFHRWRKCSASVFAFSAQEYFRLAATRNTQTVDLRHNAEKNSPHQATEW